MDPATLLILGGVAFLAAKGKKGKKQIEPPPFEPPACPVGYEWSDAERACVPSEEGPPQVAVGGLCETWDLLPNPDAWFQQWALPVLQETAQAIQAQPQLQDPAVLVGSEALDAYTLTHLILSQAPIAYATKQFPTLGLLCKLPLSEELGPDAAPGEPVPHAMSELAEYVWGYVALAVESFNKTGQFPFQEVSG